MENIIKIVRKKGYVINPDDIHVSDILNKLIMYNGRCPSVIKNRFGHNQCPCSDYLQRDICHCKLYVKQKPIRMKKLKEFFNKVKQLFSKITKSDLINFAAGLISTAATFGVVSMCLHPSYRGVIASFILIIFLGLFKEVYDKVCAKKPFNLRDIIWVVSGVVSSTILLFIVII